MLTINGNTLSTAPPLRVTPTDLRLENSTHSENPAPDIGSSFSATAYQLSEAATGAAARSQTLTPEERGQQTAALLESLTGEHYRAQKTQHDAEQPATQNSVLLARARQATNFNNGLDSNPFKGMPADQLKLIIFDANSIFTVNERRAAWQELQTASHLHRESLKSHPSREGHSLLVSRLFYEHEAPIRDRTHGLLRENTSTPNVEFLDRQDRNLLSHLYAYAQEQGADLKYVDDLAWDMGDYRKHNDGKVFLSPNGGRSYDGEGRQLSSSFTAPNAAIAQRVLNGTAIGSTLLDKGFVHFNLNPRTSPYNNGGDPGFLEAMVMKFSAESDKGYALDSRFKTYTRDPKIKDKIVHASETIRFQPREEPVLINNQGVWTITATGKAAGYVMNRVTGIPEQIEKTPDIAAKPKAPINPFEGLIGKKPAKSRLLTLFDYLFMKMKTQGRVRRP